MGKKHIPPGRVSFHFLLLLVPPPLGCPGRGRGFQEKGGESQTPTVGGSLAGEARAASWACLPLHVASRCSAPDTAQSWKRLPSVWRIEKGARGAGEGLGKNGKGRSSKSWSYEYFCEPWCLPVSDLSLISRTGTPRTSKGGPLAGPRLTTGEHAARQHCRGFENRAGI